MLMEKKFYKSECRFPLIVHKYVNIACTGCQCYKPFYGRNLQMFVINWSVFLKGLSSKVGKARSLPQSGAPGRGIN
jgi:hypothetical protein